MLKVLGALCALLLAFGAQAQDADTLKKIRDAKTITLGYRTDSPPFSFTGPDGQPAGYSVDLCKRIAASVERALGTAPLTVKWVQVTSANRFDQVASGAVDLECGNTTVTLGRQEKFDFSNLTFVDGGAVLVLSDSKLSRLADLAGKTIGVKPGTTTETALKAALKDRLIDAKVVSVKDDAEALAALNEKRIDGYAADRLVLVGNVITARQRREVHAGTGRVLVRTVRPDDAPGSGLQACGESRAGADLSQRCDRRDLRSLAGPAGQTGPAAVSDVLPERDPRITR